ncbi:MAG: hypothetical protein KDE53_08905 [Caldilineaceae bacterium]|nr:hypothetical protein [Caldilineaceae bacterium]
MAEVAAASATQNSSESNAIVFQGRPKNMAVAVAMFATGALAFSMDLTHTYFAEAIAWTFVIWGGLLLYGYLIETYQAYVVTDKALIIRNPVRFLQATKVWDWNNIQRMDVVVKRADAEYQDAIIQIHYQEPGEIVIEREDRVYDPELARLVIERAGLSATGDNALSDLTTLPQAKATYSWS